MVSVPIGVEPSVNSTRSMATLSLALAVTFVVPRTVAFAAGAVMLTDGGCVSAGGGGGGGGGGPTVPAACAARNALINGSGIPSLSGPPPKRLPTCHWPCPAHVAALATLPSGHSPVDSRIERTCAGVSAGLAPSTSAAAPATCGAAMLDPLIVDCPPPIQSERTCTPGAVTSTTDP